MRALPAPVSYSALEEFVGDAEDFGKHRVPVRLKFAFIFRNFPLLCFNTGFRGMSTADDFQRLVYMPSRGRRCKLAPAKRCRTFRKRHVSRLFSMYNACFVSNMVQQISISSITPLYVPISCSK